MSRAGPERCIERTEMDEFLARVTACRGHVRLQMGDGEFRVRDFDAIERCKGLTKCDGFVAVDVGRLVECCDTLFQNTRTFEGTSHRVVEAIEFAEDLALVGGQFERVLIGRNRAAGSV